MRVRLIIALFLCTLAVGSLRAEEQPQPIVEIQMEETQAVPGQYLALRLTVLVPTWLPKPVEFPSFEMPELRVRLGERSTTPTSRDVDGETWSGVTRRYLLSPMVPGTFEIPPQELLVQYAVPGKTESIRATVRTEPITVTGVLPDGAEGLDPFIAANGLELTQALSGPTTDLRPGAGVTRSVSAAIDGASPMVLPMLLSDVEIPGVRIYPEAPQVIETETRGKLSGSRVESVTLMAESGGAGQVPGVELRWFNFQSDQIETASVEGFEISVVGLSATPLRTLSRNWPLLLGGVAAFCVALLILRWLWPRAVQYIHGRRAVRRASKRYARQHLLRAIHRRDYGATMQCLDDWIARAPRTPPATIAEISAALTEIGAHNYGRSRETAPAGAWQRLEAVIRRGVAQRSTVSRCDLPPLNPNRAT